MISASHLALGQLLSLCLDLLESLRCARSVLFCAPVCVCLCASVNRTRLALFVMTLLHSLSPLAMAAHGRFELRETREVNEDQPQTPAQKL